MDGLIGSVDDRVALAMFGFVVATGALSLRWWQLQRAPLRLPEKAAIVYLKEDQAVPFYDAQHQPEQLPKIPYSDLEE
jgi:cytochrome oxidase assembly protein ShyY1